jgi:hypothetical protein
MWVKVDDRFPDHRKVFAAGANLGPHSTGRVLAIWLEAMCWTNFNLTDGLLPLEVVRTFKHDRQPLKVAAAMALPVGRPDGTVGPGLLIEAAGGYRIHDYAEHNDREKFAKTSFARAEAGRRGGVRSGEARRQANAKQLLQQTASTPNGNGTAKSNPVPVPVPEDQVQEQRAEAARRNPQVVEKSPEQQQKQLVAMALAEWGSLEYDGPGDFAEHLKWKAARAHLPYDGGSIGVAIDKAAKIREAEAARKARAS